MISLCALLLPLAALASPLVKNEQLEQAIRMAPVNLDKFDLLRQAGERWTYDFSQVQNYTFSPGSVNKADAYSSPVMIGTGMTMQLISLGPCKCYMDIKLLWSFTLRRFNVATTVGILFIYTVAL